MSDVFLGVKKKIAMWYASYSNSKTITKLLILHHTLICAIKLLYSSIKSI
jgi:hypothetical protein